ncbi:MAG: TIGR03086 family metal-binding protein [Candidatus Nanopelagicales bacterium]
MTAALDALAPAVELLERSLAYTRTTLASVPSDPLRWAVPTPCAEWDLAALLAHMNDALDAFNEASYGAVGLDLMRQPDVTIAGIQRKACALLGAWSGSYPAVVWVGDAHLPGRLLAATAALEITVHGWDVAQATGHPAAIPSALADDLLLFTAYVIAPEDRGRRFAAPVPVDDPASSADRLLAVTGRDPATAIR